MLANKILLQRKYSRIVEQFSKENQIPLRLALKLFYQSEVYQLMSLGISDMHCRSDHYLVEELKEEWNENKYN
jgi:hypothetical protein